MRSGEEHVKSREVPLKTGGRGADETGGMTDSNAAVVEQYAAHLTGKASSAVLSFGLVGTAGGAALGAIPGHLSHSLIAGGVNYFAVLLGALAGGIAGRSLGEKRATGLRLEAQLALRQLQVEARLLQRLSPPQPVATAPVAAPPPAPPLASPALAQVPVAPPPEPMFVPAPAPAPVLQPAVTAAPPMMAPAVVSLAPPPPPPPPPAAPRHVEQAPALPPLSS